MNTQYRPANYVVLHDSQRFLSISGDESYAEVCGEYGVSPIIGLDGNVLDSILQAVGIKPRTIHKTRYNYPNKLYEVETVIESEELNILHRVYEGDRQLIKLSVAEGENGFIRIRAVHPCLGVDGTTDDEWIEEISHFGAYSVGWRRQ